MAKKMTKVTARLAETGRLVHATNDADWARVHRPGDPDRPILHCPESSAGCANQLVAVENRVRADGGRLRSFRFTKGTADQDRCSHEVADAVLVGGKESAEHRWLKEYVCEIARELGYAAETERPLSSGLVADVWVDDAVARRRVEVQRVRTDIPGRTEAESDVLWLLRETARNNRDMNRYLFTNPCVRVNIFGPDRSPVRPWIDPDAAYEIRVFATVLRCAEDPQGPREFFETGELPLRTFLAEVWSGERKWVDKRSVYKFASWVRVADLEKQQAWLRVQRDKAAAAEAAERAARRERIRQFQAQSAASAAPAPTPPEPQPSVAPVPPRPTLVTAPPRVSLPERPLPTFRTAAPPSTWRRLWDWLTGR